MKNILEFKMKYSTKTTRWTSDLHLFHKNILKFNRDTRDGVDNRKDVKMTPFTWDEIMNHLAAYVVNSSDTERRINVII